MDKQNDLILCVAGQSNAGGYDESYVPADYLDQLDRTRIRQLGLYGDDNLNVIPLGVCAQSYQTCVPSAIRTTPAPTWVHKVCCNSIFTEICKSCLFLSFFNLRNLLLPSFPRKKAARCLDRAAFCVM